MADHIVATPRIEVSTLHKYIRDRVEPIFRKSVLMAELKKRGRISFNHGGDIMEWRPRIRRRDITAGNGNPVAISFPRTNTKMKVSLPWRQYQMGESITKYEKLTTQNSAETFFKIAQDVVKEMMDDFVESFRQKLYGDGGVNTKDIHGLESMFSVNGCVTNSKVGNPNDTYANKSTALGTLGGDWTPDTGDGWPTGTGKVEYHAWSPMVIDYQNSGWAATTKTWKNTWMEAIRYGTTYMGVLQKQEPDMLILTAEMVREMKDSLDASQHFLAEVKPTTDVGYKELTFEGLTIAYEYGVPEGCGYFLDFDAIELMSMQGQLVEKADDTDITTSTDLIALDFYGNMRFEAPSYFGKLAAITALGT
jgi:hypothetical protein